MKIGDWKATQGLNESYRAIRELGMEGPDYAKLAKQGASTRNWYS